ncbi:MAG: cupin domain-containing protein [Caulobacteraceae bacterium]|nr:cupin domain-containing protein [Caulobacteraceae bacterium]
MSARRIPLLIACLGLSALATPALAGATVTPVQASPLPNAPGLVMSAERISYAPGEASPAHWHDGFLIAYVLRGRIESQVEGEPLRTYGVGDSWTEKPGAHHVICRNASATEPAEFLVVGVAPPHAAAAKPEGSTGRRRTEEK